MCVVFCVHPAIAGRRLYLRRGKTGGKGEGGTEREDNREPTTACARDEEELT